MVNWDEGTEEAEDDSKDDVLVSMDDEDGEGEEGKEEEEVEEEEAEEEEEGEENGVNTP